jgi:hypothetical protein
MSERAGGSVKECMREIVESMPTESLEHDKHVLIRLLEMN